MSVVSAPRFRKDRLSAVVEIGVHACRRVTVFQFKDVGKRLCTTFDPDTFRNFSVLRCC